jgi:hypothetical protein
MAKIYTLEKNGVPFYVGKCTNIVRRKHKHYIKYGSSITLTVIDEVGNKKEEWIFWEKHYISLFKSWGFQLENKNDGGGGPTSYTEDQKIKMRKPRKKGTGKKISKTLLERNHSKYYTPEIRQKMGENSKGSHGGPFTDEHIRNIKTSRRKTSKRVIQLDLDSKKIKQWKSKGEAAEWIKEQTGKTSNVTSQIKDCILGRQKTAFGYKWKYKI